MKITCNIQGDYSDNDPQASVCLEIETPKEFKSDTLAVFNPPKTMVVWSDENRASIHSVIGYDPSLPLPVVTRRLRFEHCAEIPGDWATRPFRR